MVCRNRRRSLESGKEPSGEAVAVATHVMAGTRLSPHMEAEGLDGEHEAQDAVWRSRAN